MKTFSLASGSKGNCFYIESKKGIKILVDLGLSYAKTEEILDKKGINIKEINAVCITHEHSDHITGLKTFAKRVPNCPIYISKGTFEEASKMKVSEKSKRFNIIKHHTNFKIGDLNILTFNKPHDAKESISFVFNDGHKKLGIFTDLGYVPNEIKHVLKTLDIIYFEANYCEDYIEKVKIKDNLSDYYLDRLKSNVGHLSLKQACETLIECIQSEQKIILSHISQNTNTYENTYTSIKQALNNMKIFPEILIGFQEEPTEWIE